MRLAYLKTHHSFERLRLCGLSGARDEFHLAAIEQISRLWRRGYSGPSRHSGHASQLLTVFVDGVDAYFARTKSFGCKIVEDLNETIYGERQYGVEVSFLVWEGVCQEA
jgi:hypothetical protein